MTRHPWWKRLLFGPSDAQISARSVAAGGPPYPIPATDTRPPTPLTAATFNTSPESEPERLFDADRGAYRRRLAARQAERNGDTTVPTPDRTQGLGDALRATGVGSDAAIQQQPQRVHIDGILAAPAQGGPGPSPSPYATGGPITAPNPVTDSGVHTAQPEPTRITVTCPTCKGLGHMERTTSELLRESIALIPADGGQHVITEFYRRLLTAAPDLAALFPADLITAAVDDTASPGRLQRDKLLQALAALADLYGTSLTDRQRLDTALRSYGRSHAAFARPDGTTRGATVEEYLVVKQALMDTLHTAAGAAWLPAYDTAWNEAYDYAMIVMLHEQMTGGMTFPRQARAAMPAPRPRNTDA